MSTIPAGSSAGRTPTGPDTNINPKASAQPSSITAPAVEVHHRKREDARILDLIEETKEPGYHYRWVRSRQDENHLAVSRAKLKGYTPVHTKEGVKTVVAPDTRPDGIIAIGDCILMKCKVDRHQARVREKRIHREQLLASATADTEKMAKEKGLELIKDPDHGKESEKFTP
jgi:hypothetical protein